MDFGELQPEQQSPARSRDHLPATSASTPDGSEVLPPDADEDVLGAEMPMTMAASVVLEHLPRDARGALEGAGRLGVEKSES